jgi:hypothetical protein
MHFIESSRPAVWIVNGCCFIEFEAVALVGRGRRMNIDELMAAVAREQAP